MKTMKQMVVVAALLLFAVAPDLSAQSRKERRAQKQEQKEEAINRQIASKRFKIDVDYASPMGGRTIPLTSPYSLEVRNDSVISYLPYFGRAYSIPYGGGQGLNFSAPYHNYKVKRNKKGDVTITFTSRTDEDQYKFRINVYSNGAAGINVIMQNRQSIGFQGAVEE